MIHYTPQSIFDSPASVLVNPVNTVGVMGKGLAKAFAQRFPDTILSYKSQCNTKNFTIGTLQLCSPKRGERRILNFPTKNDWRDPSRIEYIEAGLQKFAATYRQRRIDSIAFPKLGCGLGGLDWDREVRPLMEVHLGDLPIDIYIHT